MAALKRTRAVGSFEEVVKIINDNSAAAANWLKFDASKPTAYSFRFVVKYFRRTVIVIR